MNAINILIIGMGFAGNEYFKSLQWIAKRHHIPMQFAYHDLEKKENSLAYYDSLTDALQKFRPNIVTVTVNDLYHANILNQLTGYSGFVICEKPLLDVHDDVQQCQSNLSDISGFSFDMVERYSELIPQFQLFCESHQLSIVRAHFTWAKNRHLDYRPTSGVISEVIHPLDLLQQIAPNKSSINIHKAIGTHSDFAVNDDAVLDSVLVLGNIDGFDFTGHSSFIYPGRDRSIQLTLKGHDIGLYFSEMIFDSPSWDFDLLRFWQFNQKGKSLLFEYKTEKKGPEQVIDKLSRMLEDVVLFVWQGKQPSLPFPSLNEAISLQYLLNDLSHQASSQQVTEFHKDTKSRCVMSSGTLESLA